MYSGTPPLELDAYRDRAMRSTATQPALTDVSVAPTLEAGATLGTLRLGVVGERPDRLSKLPQEIRADIVAEHAWRAAGDAAAMARRASERGMQVLVVEHQERFHLVLSDRRICARDARQLGRDPAAAGRVVAIADEGVVTSVPWGRATRVANGSPHTTPVLRIRGSAGLDSSPTASPEAPFGA